VRKLFLVFNLKTAEMADIPTRVISYSLADKPSKHHICDAMDALSSFAKKHRSKKAVRADKRRKPPAQDKNSNSHSTTLADMDDSPPPLEPISPTLQGSAAPFDASIELGDVD